MRFLKFSELDAFPRKTIKICVCVMVVVVAMSVCGAFMEYCHVVLDIDIILLMIVSFAGTMYLMDCCMYID